MKKRKILSCLLSLTLMMTSMPTHIWAAETENQGVQLEQKIFLNASPVTDNNCIELEWRNSESEEDSYMIYQRHITEDEKETEYHSIPANDVIKVLYMIL